MSLDPREFPPDVWNGYVPRRFRLPGFGGAGVFLRSRLVPARPSKDGAALAFDVGLLSPDRFSQYLARSAGADFIDSLADFLLHAASDFHPEQSLAGLTDPAMGLTVSAESSTDRRVGLEVTMIQDLSAQILEPDGMHFETSRAVLVTASHDLRALGTSLRPVTLEQDLWS